MEDKETAKIKESLINLPAMVAKIEAYFSKETPAATPTVPVKEEPVKEDKAEQDFSAVITEIEKQFTKTTDFDTFKATLTDKVTKDFIELQKKVVAQDEIIKEVFELVKKIADTPAEPSKFSKKDGAQTTTYAGNMEKWMKEASELTKKNFK